MKFIISIIDWFRPSPEDLRAHLEQVGQTPEQFAHYHILPIDDVYSWLDGSKKIPFRLTPVIDSDLNPII